MLVRGWIEEVDLEIRVVRFVRKSCTSSRRQIPVIDVVRAKILDVFKSGRYF